jgi:HAD superfamily hydrolase (TIGR01509 family)
MPLSTRDCWIFDMDGTLTVAAHDFDGIREELGLLPDQPILEQIARRPQHEADSLGRRLEEIEEVIAQGARPQPGVSQVLRALQQSGAQLGILTRNSEPVARITLEASGLGEFFCAADILGRESSAPKPEPDGIFVLLERWGARPERAVMIGDYRFDLEAGRAAGATTVYFDAEDEHEWDQLADYRVGDWAELLALRSATRSVG